MDAALDAALVAPVVRGVYLVAIFFDSVTIAWNSGPSDIVYGGHTYIAAGSLGSVGAIKEEPGVKSSAISLTISGVDPAVTPLVMAENYLGRTVLIHCALLDEEYLFDAARCIQVFTGRLDGITGKQGKTASFSFSVASRLSDWERTRKLIYDDADQQRLYPGDKGMEYIAQLSERKIIWPRAQFLPDPRD